MNFDDSGMYPRTNADGITVVHLDHKSQVSIPLLERTARVIDTIRKESEEQACLLQNLIDTQLTYLQTLFKEGFVLNNQGNLLPPMSTGRNSYQEFMRRLSVQSLQNYNIIHQEELKEPSILCIKIRDRKGKPFDGLNPIEISAINQLASTPFFIIKPHEKSSHSLARLSGADSIEGKRFRALCGQTMSSPLQMHIQAGIELFVLEKELLYTFSAGFILQRFLEMVSNQEEP